MLLDDVYAELALLGTDCLVRHNDKWQEKVHFPSRVIRLLEKNAILGSFDAFFCFDNKPLILFYENPRDVRALHRAIWNFNEAPIVIVAEKTEVNVYNGFRLLRNGNGKFLEKLGDKSRLKDFTYSKLVAGESWKSYAEDLQKGNRVDRLLLRNIEFVLKKLCNDCNLKDVEANALVGKVIFIRYLIDRKVRLCFRGESKYWTNDELCNLLKNKSEFCEFISYLQDKDIGFGVDVFPLDKGRLLAIQNEAFELLVRMLKGEAETGQQFLFDMFDFSVLPIEFISNVYEKFIGKKNQAKNGAYYTPTFLVDYIVKETVSAFLDTHEGWNCRVLDPACGSGIFLVESLRRMIDKYIALNGARKKKDLFKKALAKIVSENIFGIDKDPNAVYVAIFSIYLTLLDYQTPADIESFKFPNIFGTNLIHADAFNSANSTIRDLVAAHQSKTFDCIIGNPPWMRGGGDGYALVETYLRTKKNRGENCVVTNKEISQAFLIRSLDFASEHTRCALVVTSKNLYNRKARGFRQYFFRNVLLEQVFELAPVRREVFNDSSDSAIAPACILFYRNARGQNPGNQIVTHISLKPSTMFTLFKMFSLTRHDVHQIQQDRLLAFDWLWKTLLYGSYLDFQFISQLKNETPSIRSVIDDEDRFICGTGIQFSKQNKAPAQHLKGLDFIDADGVSYFSIDSTKITQFDKDFVHRARGQKKDIFSAPMLLCRKGLDPKRLTLRSALSKKDLLFKDSLTAIKAYRQEDIAILRNIAGLCASDVFAYFAINTFSSIGVEREQFLHDELLDMPYCCGLDTIVEQNESQVIEKNDLFSPASKNCVSRPYEDTIIQKLNATIKTIWNVSDAESDLLDYANSVIRPLIVSGCWEASLVKNEEGMLKQYIKVFMDKFSPVFEASGHQFLYDFILLDSWIGVRFYIAKRKGRAVASYGASQKKWWKFLTKVAQSKITERLYIQKDIRGFERNGFYLFKPNIRRLWHPAIARLDVEEFAEAMIKTGSAL